jgi:prepilin-type N-terminal cleavage/methylation domain-containing protein
MQPDIRALVAAEVTGWFGTIPRSCRRLASAARRGPAFSVMRIRGRKDGRRRGFTIVEVIMASAVMALAITTSITTMQRAFLALDTSRNLTIAGQIMVSEMEKVRMLPWTDVSPWLNTTTNLTLDSIFTSNPQIGNRFTLQRAVTQPDVANSNILQITLTMTWTGYDGRQLSRSYTTHYARYGIHDYLYNTT